MDITGALRQGLVRTAPFEFRDAGDGGQDAGDGLTLTGLAAVWDSPTEIDSWEGTFTEQIRRGAFRKTIREQTPVLQFDHGRHPVIGSIPIGRIDDIRETDEGLAVTARLTDNWLIEPVRDAIADRTVKGMSFRFDVVREEWRDNTGTLIKADELPQLLWSPGDRGPLQRTLVELRCPELGPVVFPAYTATSVDVRARQVADQLARDADAARSVRYGLVRDALPEAAPQDPALRRQVAASLLFGRPGDRTRGPHIVFDLRAGLDPEQAAAEVRDLLRRSSDRAAPPTDGHPADPEGDDAARAAADSPHGAPPADGHPPADSITDAPPADGHPSPSERTRRLRANLREIGAAMDGVLASIDTK